MLKRIAICILLVVCALSLRAQIPASEYTQEVLSGWTVMVSPELLEKDKARADSALSYLVLELIELQEILPDAAIARLKAMPIWLEYTTQNGRQLQFFLSREQLIKGKYIPEKAGSIEIVAGEYVNPKYRLTMPLLRYLMRAYLYRVVGDSNSTVLAAYNRAKTLPMYNGEHGTELTSVEQYFIVSSQAFFTSNWQEPVDRENLHELDSAGYEMVRVLWKDEGKVYAPPADGRYVEAEVLGWMLVVDTQLIDKDTSLLKTTLGLIGKELKELNQMLPSETLPLMRKAKIYLVVSDGEGNSARYWPTINKRSLSPITKRRAGNIEVVARRYIRAIRENNNGLLLHELAHAYNDRLSEAEDKIIEDTYKKAMKDKLYRRRYAASNYHEYFAELTTIYFKKNNAYPAESFDLINYDPQGYRMIESVWGISEAKK